MKDFPSFPNYAGRDDVDDLLAAELTAAGIEVVSLPFAERGEVKTKIYGFLESWSFRRAWRYWVAKGPGIPLSYAEPLHAEHGRDARVAGHCGCPSPREWYKGFGVGLYHVDGPDGLAALAATIRLVASDNRTVAEVAP